MLRGLLFVPAAVAVVLAALWAGQALALRYEREAEARIAEKFEALGLDWAGAEVHGLAILVLGTAPDAAARETALTTARLAAPFARVEDHVALSAAPPLAEAQIALTAVRTGRFLTLAGQVPAEAGLADHLAGSGLRVEDLTRAVPGRAPHGWSALLAMLEIAVGLEEASIRMEAGEIEIGGLVADAAARDAVTARLAALAPDPDRLILDLAMPVPVVFPFELAVEKDALGVTLLACAAHDAAEALAIGEMLAAAGAVGADACPHGRGGPGEGWEAQAAAGLVTLAALDEGRLVISDRTVALVAPAETSDEMMAAARARLASALPEGSEGDVLRSVPPAAAPIPASLPAPATSAGVWLRAELTEGGLTLSARMAEREHARMLDTLARARFGGDRVTAEIGDDGERAPEDWLPAIRAGLAALEAAGSGDLHLAPGNLALSCPLETPAEAGRIHRRLEAALPGWRVHTRFRIDLPARIAALPRSATRCMVEANEALAATPILFDPASARITRESRPVIDLLGAILARCPAAGFEIGGHTDSQGSARFNRELSQARAEAVLEALVARGVDVLRLSALGHGESAPVADNATEEGRAQNRRIELTESGEGG